MPNPQDGPLAASPACGRLHLSAGTRGLGPSPEFRPQGLQGKGPALIRWLWPWPCSSARTSRGSSTSPPYAALGRPPPGIA